jgi:hypothetical protein
MITRSTFNEEYVPGYFALAVETYQSAEKMYDKIAEVRTSVKKEEKKLYRSNLGYLSEKGEGEPIGYDTPIGNRSKTWVHKVYALGVRATEEAIDDNLYEFGSGGSAGQDIKELFKDLGTSAAETPEIETAKLFNFATATTYHTCNDGLAFASALHTRLDGSIFSNLQTSTDLTYASFWSAVILAENQYDHRQKRIRAKVKALLIPPQMERQAREVLYSTDRPDTGNRAINAMVQSGRSIQLMMWQYLTDVDAWALLLDSNDILFFWRRRTRFAKEGDFETGDLRSKVDQRFSVEVGDPRCVLFNIP